MTARVKYHMCGSKNCRRTVSLEGVGEPLKFWWGRESDVVMELEYLGSTIRLGKLALLKSLEHK